MPDIQIKRMKITPQRAEMYLATSLGNRKTNTNRVWEYARDMASGKWEEYSPASMIAFDKKGHLVDGHHRLMAVVKSKQTVGFLVTNTDAKVFDRGFGRTLSNTIQMQGYGVEHYNKAVVSLARFHFSYDLGINMPSDSEVTEYICENVNDLNLIVAASRTGGSKKPLCLKCSVQHAAFLALRNGGVQKEILSEFFKIANSGYATSDRDSAAITLRNQILNDFRNDGGTRSLFVRITEEAIKDFSKATPRRRKYAGNTAPFEGKE